MSEQETIVCPSCQYPIYAGHSPECRAVEKELAGTQVFTTSETTSRRRPGGEFIRTRKDDSLRASELLQYCDQPDRISPFVYDIFSDPDFVRSIPEHLRRPEELARYLENSSRFSDAIPTANIYGELVQIPETEHHDGRVRRAESGQRVILDKIRALGIDPNYVLYFRRSQPSSEPKPEDYWTSDYWETQTGLTVEISDEQRRRSVILCSSLEDIDTNSGLIKDINDDNGLSVRRITRDPYDQRRVLFLIYPGGNK